MAQHAGCSRLVWNKALAFQKERLNVKQSCLSYAGLTKELTQWKKEPDLFFLKEVHSQALQQSLKNPQHPSSSIIGGDLGIARFLTLSNQKYYESINVFKRLKAKLAKLQKRLRKKEKFSNRWRGLKSKITKLHIRIANIRNDYLHRISSQLSKNHAIVILEDLKVFNLPLKSLTYRRGLTPVGIAFRNCRRGGQKY